MFSTHEVPFLLIQLDAQKKLVQVRQNQISYKVSEVQKSEKLTSEYSI